MTETENQIQSHPRRRYLPVDARRRYRRVGRRQPRPRPAGTDPAAPDGTLLDGRNRDRAGLEIGIESRLRTWEPKGESEVAIVLSLNLHRRPLTSSQRACVAVSILPHLEARAQERERIRKSAAATPEKSPDSEQGERVQAHEGIGYDGRTEEEIEEENRERNPKRKRDAEVRRSGVGPRIPPQNRSRDRGPDSGTRRGRALKSVPETLPPVLALLEQARSALQCPADE